MKAVKKKISKAKPKSKATAKSKSKKLKPPANLLPVLVEPSHSLPAVQDNLPAYLNSLKAYPLLNPETEKEVAIRYRENQDPAAAKTLVVSNLRLVVKIAMDYMRSGFNLLDLIQEGNIGLLQAVKDYDPYRNVKFSSYASYWIKAYIRTFILKNWSLVKMGTTRAQRSLFYKLQKEKNQLEAVGIVPETKYLAEKFSVKEREVNEMTQRLSGRDLSLDAPLSHQDESDGGSLLQILSDATEAADDRLAQEEIKEEFTERLNSFEKTLSGKELVVFRERLRSDEPKTLQEIGDTYGITRERVRQIESRLLEKLKDYMKKNARFMETIIDV
ncbi:MAG: RNA polymerase subunit sigma-70 [Deltaproteobacteria bacterium CG11_big_fil_rev_8_21_14_0_20_45_16]|nr:MAG: RNA polymerase subunit sigma-70 [Deltaproteobacteria bacterium CG11_big_fil_rev_8_21_14_0_20_45_16]